MTAIMNSLGCSRNKFIVLLLGMTALAISLGGCKSSGESKFIDAVGMQKEHRAAAANLKLPPGVVFRKKANEGGGGSFEKGVGLGLAQWYWISAWEHEWLEQRNKDGARARKALDVLKNEVPKSETMTNNIDDYGRRLYAGNLKKAELGDPSGFQQEVEVNPIDLQHSSERK